MIDYLALDSIAAIVLLTTALVAVLGRLPRLGIVRDNQRETSLLLGLGIGLAARFTGAAFEDLPVLDFLLNLAIAIGSAGVFHDKLAKPAAKILRLDGRGSTLGLLLVATVGLAGCHPYAVADRLRNSATLAGQVAADQVYKRHAPPSAQWERLAEVGLAFEDVVVLLTRDEPPPYPDIVLAEDALRAFLEPEIAGAVSDLIEAGLVRLRDATLDSEARAYAALWFRTAADALWTRMTAYHPYMEDTDE